MGYFDWVNVPPMPCVACDKSVTDWQTEDGEPSCSHVSLCAVDRFYAICNHCGSKNEYRRRRRSVAEELNEFDVVATSRRRTVLLHVPASSAFEMESADAEAE